MRNVRIFATAGLLCAALLSGHAAADIHVTDKGEGPALVFIPGLNSGSDTFTETCEAFVATHRCVLLDLPGFAGQPPVDVSNGFPWIGEGLLLTLHDGTQVEVSRRQARELKQRLEL